MALIRISYLLLMHHIASNGDGELAPTTRQQTVVALKEVSYCYDFIGEHDCCGSSNGGRRSVRSGHIRRHCRGRGMLLPSNASFALTYRFDSPFLHLPSFL